METQNTSPAETVHPFEKAGLGKAPFKFVGAVSQNVSYGQAVVGHLNNGVEILTKAGGTCAYCGAGILNMYNVKSADGKTFHVGSDCILKVGGPDLAKKVNKAIAAKRKATAAANAEKKIAAAIFALTQTETRSKLASKPHPTIFLANKGETLLTWVEWVMAHCGPGGQLNAAKAVLLEMSK